MKITILAFLAAVTLASAGDSAYQIAAAIELEQQRQQAQLEQINRNLRQIEQQQREAERERHYQAERDFTFKVIFGE